jgi:apolipoprotein N-acyltransferase
MSIFRQAGTGISIVTDAYGHEVSRVDSFTDTPQNYFAAVHTESVPVKSVRTLYPQIGDVFGQIMLFGLAALLVGIWLTRKAKYWALIAGRRTS